MNEAWKAVPIAVLLPALAAACTAAPGAPHRRVSPASVSAGDAVRPEPGEGRPNQRTIELTPSGCTLDVDDLASPINANHIRFRVPSGLGGVARKTVLDFGKLDERHSFHELEAYVDGLGSVPSGLGAVPALEEQAPPYFDTSLQGSVERGYPHFSEGPLNGSSALGLDPGWSGTWFGPRGGATPGTYAVICYRHSPDGWRALGVAGPVEVRRNPTWEPSWAGRPDATIVLTGSGCEQVGGAGVIDPGVFAIEFVDEAHLEGLFRVVRLGRGQRLRDLWDDVLPLIGRRSSTFLGPSRTDIWSSPRETTSGRWAVLCWKDRIAASNGFQMERAGIVGPFEIG